MEELSLENPVFAAGVNFFHRLGGVNEVVETLDGMKEAVARHIKEVRQLKADGQFEKLGPWGRGGLGAERGGRKTRIKVMAQMKQEFDAVADKYLNA